MTRPTFRTLALLVLPVALFAKPVSTAPKRGPIPPYFFKPVSIASSQYPEEKRRYLQELDFQVSVKGENTKEAGVQLGKLLAKAIGPMGFRALSEDEVSKFHFWKDNRPQGPEDTVTRIFGSEVFYATQDVQTFQKQVAAATPFSSRSEGEMKGQVRQFFLIALGAGGSSHEGYASFRIRFTPTLIGSISYDKPKIQEGKISNKFALFPLFDAEPVLSELKAKLESIASEAGIKDLKANLKP
jgi:hypothetical protein